MRITALTSTLLLGLTSAAALAHHGWGSYDADTRMTIESAVENVSWQNPHAELTVQHEGEAWLITLAPLSRLQARGLASDMLQPGTAVAAAGHPSRRNPNEMRAERIIVAGRTYEMR